MIDRCRVADEFRLALDREDWPAVERLLAADCQYQIGEKSITGPGDIIAAYSANAEWGRENLDGIGYESELAQTGDRSFSIQFTDHLRHGEATHTFQCQQEIEVGESGKIVRIVHHELTGQRARLNAFLARCGLSRD